MRASWILFASTLCTSAYSQSFQASGSAQQVLDSSDVFSNSYKCENGAKPTPNCVHPSEKPTCACTCSNGITFNQPLSPNPPTYPSDEACQKAKADCLLREQQLNAQLTEAQQSAAAELNKIKQEHLLREQDLLQKEQQLTDELNSLRSPPWKYIGCYTDNNYRMLRDGFKKDDNMTRDMCAAFCKGRKYYGVQYSVECFCGDSFMTATENVPENKCNMKCGGGTLNCGGSHKMNIFEKVY